MVAGLIVRILASRSVLGRPDSDEATGMLMAQQAAHSHFFSFFWGGAYGGTLIPILEAPFIRLFGFSILFFRLFNTGITLLSAVVLWAITRRTLGRWGAVVATAIFLLAPAEWVLWSTREYVWWTGGTLWALLVVFCCLRWSETKAQYWLWGLGVLTGLVFWTYPLFGCLVGTPVVLVAWMLRRRLLALCQLVLFAVIGAAPWLWTNLMGGFGSLNPPMAVTQPLSLRLKTSIKETLPRGTILRLAHASPRGASLLGAALLVSAVLAVLYAMVRRQPVPASAAVCVLMWPALIVASGVFLNGESYRYAFVLAAPVAVLVAWLVRRPPPFAVGVVVVVVWLSVASLWRGTQHFKAVPMEDANTKALVARLVADHRTHVYAGYWVSYLLSVESNTRVTASPTVVVRDVEYQRLADTVPKATYVFTAGQGLDQQVNQWLQTHRGGTRISIGQYAVYEFDGPIRPEHLPVQSAL
jgi:hypothetical protein